MGFSPAEQEWQDHLAKIQALQKSTTFPGATNPVTKITYGSASPPIQPTTQLAQAAVRGGQQVASGQTQRTANAAGVTSSPTDNKASNDMVSRTGRFYSDYPYTSLAALAAPGAEGQAASKWAKFYGMGGNAYANYMSSVLKDPMALLKGMGVNAGSLVDAQDRMDWYNRLWNLASGRQKLDGGYGYLSGRGIVHNILNSRYGEKDAAGSLGQITQSPDLTPDQQVSNTIQLLLGSLQGVIGQDALQAYQSTLGRLGQEFMDQQMKDPARWGKVHFNDYLRQRLGPGGGIY
jgi:hypothetical protein